MSKSFRYVDSFDFPQGFGFSQSANGPDLARDQPLTPERQGLEYGEKGNFNRGQDVQALARGGRLAKPRGPSKPPVAAAPKQMMPKAPARRPAPPPAAPGPSPAPGMSPLAQAMGSPGLPAGAMDSGAPAGQMAMGGRMSEQRVQRAGGGILRQRFDGGGAMDRDNGPTPQTMAAAGTSYDDENDRRGTPGRYYAGEAERGRMGARNGAKPAARKAAPPPRPLPVPPAYVPPPRGTVSVNVRQRPRPSVADTGANPDTRYDFGAGMPAKADGGRLSMADRKKLPSSDFALPGKGAGPSGKGAGSYPIPDASHARNALSRVAQHGSPTQKSEVREKVHAKFPGIGKADGGYFEDKSRMRHVGERQGFFNGGHAKMHEQFGFTGSTARQKKADGGLMRRDDAPKGNWPEEKTSMPRQMEANTPAMAKGGHAKHPDEAQDRALIKRMMAQHEKAEGEKPMKMARGGRTRLPTGMKATALQRHSPINTPPRNPMRTTTPRNIAPGGQLAYGVQPSSEPDKAGSRQGIPQLAKGGRVKAGCY